MASSRSARLLQAELMPNGVIGNGVSIIDGMITVDSGLVLCRFVNRVRQARRLPIKTKPAALALQLLYNIVIRQRV